MRKFSPDIRNFGGRKVISDQHRNHYDNLANIQSTLKTQQRLPTSLSQKRKSFQKSSDCSFHITKNNKNILSEHLLNIKHMNRRIHSIGSYNERKKNPYDPITHPVVFFRNGQEKDDPTLNQEFVARSVKPPKLSSVYDSQDKKVKTSLEVRIDVPYVETSERNPIKALNSQLFEIIVKNRIYKEDDIQSLFKYTREVNSHLSKNTVEKAINLTYSTLNS